MEEADNNTGIPREFLVAMILASMYDDEAEFYDKVELLCDNYDDE